MTPREQAVVDLISTDELQLALMNRFDTAVFHGLKERPTQENPNAHIKAWGVRGDLYKCLGMGKTLEHRILTMIADADVEASVDEL